MEPKVGKLFRGGGIQLSVAQGGVVMVMCPATWQEEIGKGVNTPLDCQIREKGNSSRFFCSVSFPRTTCKKS